MGGTWLHGQVPWLGSPVVREPRNLAFEVFTCQFQKYVVEACPRQSFVISFGGSNTKTLRDCW